MLKITRSEADNIIKLLNKDGSSIGVISSFFESKTLFIGKNMSTLVQAEIISLARNILITRDDFELVNFVKHAAGSRPSDSIQADHCSCWNNMKGLRSVANVVLYTVYINIYLINAGALFVSVFLRTSNINVCSEP
jgi:hypothetical protein